MGPSTDQPLEIDLDRTRELRIRWSDGHETVHPLVMLRKACPCATCREQRAAQKPTQLPLLQSPAEQASMVTALKAELVGHYALSITWMDGHKAGIYDFAMLRAMSDGGDVAKSEPRRSRERKKG